jgi:hypothetical protein
VITVVVDRTAVANGDDVPHERTWTFADDARMGEVVLRALDDSFLAPVAGNISWLLRARNSAQRVFAIIDIDYFPEHDVRVTDGDGKCLESEISSLLDDPEEDGFRLYFQYITFNVRNSPSQLRERLARSKKV